MAPLRFAKYEGLGNDFLVVDAGRDALLATERVRAVCDRHFGVGGDGVLLVIPASSAEARAKMVVLNADGSRPEMCGNGLRCVALHLARQDAANGISYVVDTDAGPRLVQVERTGNEAMVTVNMGRGRVESDYQTEFRGKKFEFQRVSMGNPHAIVFETGLDTIALDELGPAVSRAFPEGTNVEFATKVGASAFELIVWERGVGRTLACGTGACATAVAAALSGRAPFATAVEMRLPGGPLELTVANETLEVTMRGPAKFVFSGEV